MEEIDLKELIGMFWSKKLQIILLIIIFMVIGITYTIGFTTPLYSSATKLILASSKDNQEGQKDISSQTQMDINVNQKLVSTYSEVVKSNNVIRQVIENLGIDTNEDQLKKAIKVSAVDDTEIIVITVTTKDAENSAKIANEIANVFSDKVKEIYKIENVQVLDPAEVAKEPSNINHTKDVVIFGFIGLVVAVMYVLVANMLDTTIKTAEEVEKEFKIPVIASIPIYDIPEKQKKKKKGGRR